jgi:hypothetical protein
VVGFARLEDGARERRLVGRIGKMLGFEAEGGVLAIHHPVVALEAAIEEVTGIELHAGLVGGHCQRAARDGLIHGGWLLPSDCHLISRRFSSRSRYPAHRTEERLALGRLVAGVLLNCMVDIDIRLRNGQQLRLAQYEIGEVSVSCYQVVEAGLVV